MDFTNTYSPKLLQSIFAWLRYRQLMRRREQDVIPLRAAR
jgi:hypothetical protein